MNRWIKTCPPFESKPAFSLAGCPRQVFGLESYLLVATSQLAGASQCRMQRSFSLPLRGSPGFSPGSLFNAFHWRAYLESMRIAHELRYREDSS